MDWYDGEPNCTIGEALGKAPKMRPRPTTPKWDNEHAIASFSLGAIYELKTAEDRMMHTQTCTGHCFVWNAPNQLHEDGFRLYTFRSKDGWGRVSILAHTLDTLIDGSGGRMYCGNWRAIVGERGARLIAGEPIVLLDYDSMYVWGSDSVSQSEVEAMKAQVLSWYKSLPLVDVPEPTADELARTIVHR